MVESQVNAGLEEDSVIDFTVCPFLTGSRIFDGQVECLVPVQKHLTEI